MDLRDIIVDATAAAERGARVVVLAPAGPARRTFFIEILKSAHANGTRICFSWMRWWIRFDASNGEIAVEADARHLSGRAIDRLLVLGDPGDLRAGLLEYAEALIERKKLDPIKLGET